MLAVLAIGTGSAKASPRPSVPPPRHVASDQLGARRRWPKGDPEGGVNPMNDTTKEHGPDALASEKRSRGTPQGATQVHRRRRFAGLGVVRSGHEERRFWSAPVRSSSANTRQTACCPTSIRVPYDESEMKGAAELHNGKFVLASEVSEATMTLRKLELVSSWNDIEDEMRTLNVMGTGRQRWLLGAANRCCSPHARTRGIGSDWSQRPPLILCESGRWRAFCG